MDPVCWTGASWLGKECNSTICRQGKLFIQLGGKKERKNISVPWNRRGVFFLSLCQIQYTLQDILVSSLSDLGDVMTFNKQCPLYNITLDVLLLSNGHFHLHFFFLF